MKKGYSLIELLIVIAIFAILSIVVTQSVITSLKSSRKSESTIKAKESLSYALAIMERNIRNSKTITVATASPSPTTGSTVTIEKDDGTSAIFQCKQNSEGIGYIEVTSSDISGLQPGLLTSTATVNVNCTNNPTAFWKDPTNLPNGVSSISLILTGSDPKLSGSEAGRVDLVSRVTTRGY